MHTQTWKVSFPKFNCGRALSETLKLVSQELGVFIVQFEVDIKPSVPGDMVEISIWLEPGTS